MKFHQRGRPPAYRSPLQPHSFLVPSALTLSAPQTGQGWLRRHSSPVSLDPCAGRSLSMAAHFPRVPTLHPPPLSPAKWSNLIDCPFPPVPHKSSSPPCYLNQPSLQHLPPLPSTRSPNCQLPSIRHPSQPTLLYPPRPRHPPSPQTYSHLHTQPIRPGVPARRRWAKTAEPRVVGHLPKARPTPSHWAPRALGPKGQTSGR